MVEVTGVRRRQRAANLRLRHGVTRIAAAAVVLWLFAALGTSVSAAEPAGPVDAAAPGTVYQAPAIGYAFGANNRGELGIGGVARAAKPTSARYPPGTTSLLFGEGHAMALTDDGSVYTWAARDVALLGGQAGAGFTKVEFPSGAAIRSVASDRSHAVAVANDGSVFAWGANDHGQLGSGDTATSDRPKLVTGLPAITEVAAGARHTVAVAVDGRLYAWGDNNRGQLGVPVSGSVLTPVQVQLPGGATATHVAAGSDHSVVIAADGQVYTFGANRSGQLGDGTTTDRDAPVAVLMPPGQAASSVTAGNNSSAVLTRAGQVLAWGENGSGQLGDSSTQTRLAPVPVAIPDGLIVSSLSATANHSIALTTTGDVVSWGQNNWGQLGDGTTANRATPVRIEIPVDEVVRAVTAGPYQSAVLVQSGSLATIVLVTNTPVIAENSPATFRAYGFDGFGHALGALRSGVSLTIDGGTCDGMTCAAAAGDRLVTANLDQATGTTTLHVLAPPTSTTTTTSNTQPTPGPTDPGSGTITTQPSPSVGGPSSSAVSTTASGTTGASSVIAAGPGNGPMSGSGSLSYTGVSRWLQISALIAAIAVTTGISLLATARRRRLAAAAGTDPPNRPVASGHSHSEEQPS